MGERVVSLEQYLVSFPKLSINGGRDVEKREEAWRAWASKFLTLYAGAESHERECVYNLIIEQNPLTRIHMLESLGVAGRGDPVPKGSAVEFFTGIAACYVKQLEAGQKDLLLYLRSSSVIPGELLKDFPMPNNGNHAP